MKNITVVILLALLLIALVGCSNEPELPAAPSITPTATSNVEGSGETNAPAEPSASIEPSASTEPSQSGEQTSAMVIQIIAGEDIVTYELNDSIAAKNLYEQLPLTVEVENYSSNEKIFYPPQTLDVSDAPQASGGFGVLAYYAPWGDVILFYDDFSRNSSLYELGQVVSGSEHIQSMEEGTITIEAAP